METTPSLSVKEHEKRAKQFGDEAVAQLRAYEKRTGEKVTNKDWATFEASPEGQKFKSLMWEKDKHTRAALRNSPPKPRGSYYTSKPNPWM